MKITTLRMADALHKQIRRQALDENASMNTYILQALETKTKTERERETEINSKGDICPMCYEKREKKNDRR
jgi:hypothetical protein